MPWMLLTASQEPFSKSVLKRT